MATVAGRLGVGGFVCVCGIRMGEGVITGDDGVVNMKMP